MVANVAELENEVKQVAVDTAVGTTVDLVQWAK